jgi:two-component system, chemotaxis family, chemotaxis protein CheY
MRITRPDENNDGITAIVIDDDVDTVEVLAEFLAIKGINVIGKGYDGLEAIMMYMDLKPTVVFLDVMMQSHDGFYTLEKIRKIHPDAIVILITGDVTKETRKKLLKLDASAIIYKPYDINEVIDVTNSLVLKLQQELLRDIAAKKARLDSLNTILGNHLSKSERDAIRKAQYFDDKEKLV